ncbi:hypothetical protein BgiMline_036706 [Biomphalaria glabrata]
MAALKLFLLSLLAALGKRTTADVLDLKPTVNMGKQFNIIVPHISETFDRTKALPRLEFHFYGHLHSYKNLILLSSSQMRFRPYQPTRAVMRNVVLQDGSLQTVIVSCVHNDICNQQLTEGRTWLFQAVGSHQFGMYVHFFVSESSSATFTPLPVEALGQKYFAVTLKSEYFIGIVAADYDVNVIITFNFQDDNKVIEHDGIIYRNYDIATVTVIKHEGYIISACKDSNFDGYLTGTSLEGNHPFGVITGSCSSGTLTNRCDGSAESVMGEKDMAAEMLMPSETFGRDFIVFPLLGRQVPGYFWITASKDETFVSMKQRHNNEFQTPIYMCQSQTVNFTLTYTYILSNKGIQVVVVQRSACLATDGVEPELGDPSLSIIVPLALGYHTYSWRFEPDLSTEYYVTIIVRIQHMISILLDNTKIADKNEWIIVRANNVTWTVTHLKFIERHITQHSLTSPSSTFGCYLYGFTLGTGHMEPLGFIVSPLNLPCQVDASNETEVPVDDLLDNDCDGFVDEEFLDGVDNDKDSQIDEDTNSFKVLREYEPWSEWACGRDCNDTRMYRYRECKKDLPNVICQGEANQSKPEDCYINGRCPSHTPERFTNLTTIQTTQSSQSWSSERSTNELTKETTQPSKAWPSESQEDTTEITHPRMPWSFAKVQFLSKSMPVEGEHVSLLCTAAVMDVLPQGANCVDVLEVSYYDLKTDTNLILAVYGKSKNNTFKVFKKH